MSAKQDFVIYFTTTESGAVLAATNEAPYFCFEARTQQEAEQTVIRALTFYEDAKRRIANPVRSHSIEVSRFVASMSRRRHELGEVA